MISGARYSGVPHNVQVLPFTRLAKPKSVTLKPKKHRSQTSVSCSSLEQHFLLGFCVADLNVAVVVDEKVLRFQISVYEV